MGRLSAWTLLALMLLAFAAAVQDVRADVPSENECRPYIEKALHELKGDAAEDGAVVISDDDNNASNEDTDDNSQETETETDSSDSKAEQSAEDATDDVSAEAGVDGDGNDNDDDDNVEKSEEAGGEDSDQEQASREKRSAEEDGADGDDDADENVDDDADAEDDDNDSKTENDDSTEVNAEEKSDEQDTADSGEDDTDADKASGEAAEVSAEDKDSKEDAAEEEDDDEKAADDDAEDEDNKSAEAQGETEGDSEADDKQSGEQAENDDDDDDDDADSKEKSGEVEEAKSSEDATDDDDVNADDGESAEEVPAAADASVEASVEQAGASGEEDDDASDSREKRDVSGEDEEESVGEADDGKDSTEDAAEDATDDADDAVKESEQDEADDSKEDDAVTEDDDSKEEASEVSKPVESFPEDDLLIEYEVPTNLRDHSHVTEILRLDEQFDEKEAAINKVADVVLKDLKKIYENAIKPLETLYKYRDLSNRHFGDPEIFSKPLVLFMGPWSGGKSTILNYLTENEHTGDSLRTGAEPSPAYFNILMHGDKPEVLDGTQLAADWTFSGLQKFGQGLEDRLRGQKLPHKLLEKVNIVEIPGILEVRKQVSRLFPFNDACQWFIDRADIIFLVYDPSKLDVGPETEAILDQLKGREYQTRILLNKADQVKPEELLRVQGALIWNISPLMSSAQPPVMYTTSLWSHPYEEGAPVRLLQAQERALLRDLRVAIDKRIDNKIASARRFAVRVRNHAKMVDCYLTTYYNHKTLFGNKNQIATNIIENPSNYHIYEGLSTLTNISRYDLPDPEVYRDFFRLNKLYDFQKLSETCTYFRGCPINKLDVAIAYDLPELVGKYKKAAEAALTSIDKKAEGGKS